MRRFLLATMLSLTSGLTAAAGVVVDPGQTFGPLGFGEFQPEALSTLPAQSVDIPLPENVEPALPRFRGNPEGGFDINPGAVNQFPELPGLSGLSSIELEIELPGLDGLPISGQSRIDPQAPVIPGFDGLPLGFGRR